jgi:hypothetical protein
MLPNSRIIPPSTNNNKNQRRRSNSASASGMLYESNQQKKGFISRLLANPNTSKEPYQHNSTRSKYENVLGFQQDLNSRNNSRSTDSILKVNT